MRERRLQIRAHGEGRSLRLASRILSLTLDCKSVRTRRGPTTQRPRRPRRPIAHRAPANPCARRGSFAPPRDGRILSLTLDCKSVRTTRPEEAPATVAIHHSRVRELRGGNRYADDSRAP